MEELTENQKQMIRDADLTAKRFIMPEHKDPKNLGNKYNNDSYIKLVKKKCFSIGQSYEKEFAQKLVCKHCGSDKFFVGQGSYFTAIKCETCQYEICIHEG